MKGWKTLIIGAIIAGLGALDAVELANVVPEEYAGAIVGVIGALIIWLRNLTTTPIGKAD